MPEANNYEVGLDGISAFYYGRYKIKWLFMIKISSYRFCYSLQSHTTNSLGNEASCASQALLCFVVKVKALGAYFLANIVIQVVASSAPRTVGTFIVYAVSVRQCRVDAFIILEKVSCDAARTFPICLIVGGTSDRHSMTSVALHEVALNAFGTDSIIYCKTVRNIYNSSNNAFVFKDYVACVAICTSSSIWVMRAAQWINLLAFP